MLNLFKQKIKLHGCALQANDKKQNDFIENNVKPLSKRVGKHFPSPIREWNNSIYVFNKNSLNLIPSTTKLVKNIIKSYFNLYNKRLEYKMRTKVLSRRLRRLSSNKFYISNGGFKHTNNKVCINLYVFNRQKSNYILTLRKWYLKTFMIGLIKNKTLNQTNNKIYKNNLKIRLIKKLNMIKFKGIQAAIAVNKDKYSLIKGLNTVFLNKKLNINKFKSFSNYTKNFYKDLMKKSLKKIRMYFYYKQLLYINKSKLNYTYLQYLKKYLEKIYNKNVEFNIINLKKFFLNSDILSESITLKITRNRRKLLKFLNKLKHKIKVEKKKVFLGFDTEEKSLKNFTNGNNTSNDLLEKYVVNKLKYKDITGFRLETKGRLNKRFTASRSVHKHRHKGGIYNMDSSFRGLSSVLLKGNLKSNTQYTKLSSKTRIGSFGIKGWVSGN